MKFPKHMFLREMFTNPGTRADNLVSEKCLGQRDYTVNEIISLATTRLRVGASSLYWPNKKKIDSGDEDAAVKSG